MALTAPLGKAKETRASKRKPNVSHHYGLRRQCGCADANPDPGIGKPDPVALEVVKAFVSLKKGFEPGEAVRKELRGFARSRLGAAVAPKETDFVASLPKNRAGKIMRRLLKARQLGLPEGDISNLESGPKTSFDLPRCFDKEQRIDCRPKMLLAVDEDTAGNVRRPAE